MQGPPPAALHRSGCGAACLSPRTHSGNWGVSPSGWRASQDPTPSGRLARLLAPQHRSAWRALPCSQAWGRRQCLGQRDPPLLQIPALGPAAHTGGLRSAPERSPRGGAVNAHRWRAGAWLVSEETGPCGFLEGAGREQSSWAPARPPSRLRTGEGPESALTSHTETRRFCSTSRGQAPSLLLESSCDAGRGADREGWAPAPGTSSHRGGRQLPRTRVLPAHPLGARRAFTERQQRGRHREPSQARPSRAPLSSQMPNATSSGCLHFLRLRNPHGALGGGREGG